jgi:hypothetical protein
MNEMWSMPRIQEGASGALCYGVHRFSWRFA